MRVVVFREGGGAVVPFCLLLRTPMLLRIWKILSRFCLNFEKLI